MTYQSYVQEFKILRDFLQFAFISLYFEIKTIQTQYTEVTESIPRLLSLDFIVNSTAKWILLVVVLILTVLLLYYGRYEPNPHFLLEARTWKNKSAFTRTCVSFILTVYTSAFQPCNVYLIYNGILNSDSVGGTVIAILLLIYFDIFFSIMLMRKIKRDIPRVMDFNPAGQQAPITDARYVLVIEKSESPYKSFFEA